MDAVGVQLPGQAANTMPETTVRFAQMAEEAGLHSVWKGEASWGNGLMTLSVVASETDDIRVGTCVANVFSRTPVLLAMSAATLDSLSDGRTILGLGTSSPALVEDWHGLHFDRPLRRLRESFEILRSAFRGGRLEYDGKIFDVGPYGIGFDIERDSIPLFNAAMGPMNCRLTGEFADGWLPSFVPLGAFDEALGRVKAGALAADRGLDEITVAPLVGAAATEDPSRAEGYVRDFLAQEMGVGYDRIASRYGFEEAAVRAGELWREGDRGGAAEAISRDMLDQMTIYGSPADCREQVRAYHDAGSDLVILYPTHTAPPEVVERTIRAFG